jgi:hypothetical protein
MRLFPVAVLAALFLGIAQPMLAADGPVTQAPAGLTLYVSLQGNDAWSGKPAAPDAAKADGPLATLEGARNRIREIKKAGPLPAGGVTVLVRGGDYFLPQTLALGAEDSGTPESPVVYRAYGNEKPVLVGGRPVSGFVVHKGAILKADLAAQGLKGIYFRQLFFDGRRQHLARYPNFDPKNPYGGGWAYADGTPIPMYTEIPDESKKELTYKPQDARTWSKPDEGEVFVFARYNWWNNIIRIASIDREKRLVTLTSNASYPIRPGDRYYVRNVFEELDAPGEWYLDRQTWTLYFWPPAALTGKTVVAPTLKTILKISGAANITFRGFTIECCEGTAVVLENTNDCLIAGSTIRNVGDYNGSGVSVGGGKRNGVAGNDIYETGSHGVSLSGGDRITLTPAENYADNNYIHHTGVFYKQGVGVSLSGVGNRASHNLIHDGPRFGILFGGNNLIIEYNHIRHVNLETADTGAVYTGGRDWISSRGTKIRYNYFHDILGYGMENGKWISPHYAWGVYLDDNTGGVDVVGNIVARCVRGLVHLHNGRDNLVENNILIDGTLQQVEANGWNESSHMWRDHLPTMIKGYDSVAGQPAWREMRGMDLHPTKAVRPDDTIMSGNVIRRNIIYYHDPKAKVFKLSRMSPAYNVCQENLVYHFGLPLLTGTFQVKEGDGPNLVANPGFEEGVPGALPKGWSWQHRPAGAQAAVACDVRASGVQSLLIEGAEGKDGKGNPQWPTIVSAEIPATPGQTFRIVAKMKAEKAGMRAVLMAQSYIANVYFWSRETVPTLGTEWQTVELAFKLPAPGEQGYNEKMQGVRVRLEVRQPAGKVWIDEVSLKAATPMDEWESWKALWKDTRSVVADPMFVNPDKDDYRLKPGSPAFKLGFKPIPVEKIGPYASTLRASWPIVEASGARETPLVSEK